jgi:CheY-like chemotaxis protein
LSGILVVEDEERIRRVLALQLELEGYEVEAVASGEECLASLQERLPRLIVLDYLLPDFSGEEIVQRLRRMQGGKRLPVLLLSGLERQDLDRWLLEDPFVHFLAKPFENRELLALVKRALGKD